MDINTVADELEEPPGFSEELVPNPLLYLSILPSMFARLIQFFSPHFLWFAVAVANDHMGCSEFIGDFTKF